MLGLSCVGNLLTSFLVKQSWQALLPLLLAGSATASCSVKQVNLVQNPSFEDGLSYWRVSGDLSVVSSSSAADGRYYLYGSHCISRKPDTDSKQGEPRRRPEQRNRPEHQGPREGTLLQYRREMARQPLVFHRRMSRVHLHQRQPYRRERYHHHRSRHRLAYSLRSLHCLRCQPGYLHFNPMQTGPCYQGEPAFRHGLG